MGHINELQLKLRTYLTLVSSTYHTVHHVSLFLSLLLGDGRVKGEKKDHRGDLRRRANWIARMKMMEILDFVVLVGIAKHMMVVLCDGGGGDRTRDLPYHIKVNI